MCRILNIYAKPSNQKVLNKKNGSTYDVVKISIGRQLPAKKDVKVDGEWNKFLKEKQRDETSYFLFSLRMMSYGLCCILLTLFFVTKLVKTMTFYDKMLIGFYLLTILFLFTLVFFDVGRFNRKKFYT